MCLIVLLVIGLLLVVQLILSMKENSRDPQLFSLEAGFERLKYRNFLRAPFFILGVLFVFFDIELILLLPGVLMLTLTLEWSFI